MTEAFQIKIIFIHAEGLFGVFGDGFEPQHEVAQNRRERNRPDWRIRIRLEIRLRAESMENTYAKGISDLAAIDNTGNPNSGFYRSRSVGTARKSRNANNSTQKAAKEPATMPEMVGQ